MSPQTEKFCWQRNDAAGDEAAESEVKHSAVLRKKGIQTRQNGQYKQKTNRNVKPVTTAIKTFYFGSRHVSTK